MERLVVHLQADKLEYPDMEKINRAAPRVNVNLKARWEGVHSQSQATITNLSRSGCFLLSGGSVEVRELVSLQIELPDLHRVRLWAEVVDEASEIGFAVRFNSCSEEDAERLESYIEDILLSAPLKRP